jgi:hypothetical protein
MTREELEKEYGRVWDTQELTEDFDVFCFFMAPMVIVCRKQDGARGTMLFQHFPRFYYDFQPEK